MNLDSQHSDESNPADTARDGVGLQHRKAAMLVHLQREMAGFHAKKRARRRWLTRATVTMGMIGFAILLSLAPWSESPEDTSQERAQVHPPGQLFSGNLENPASGHTRFAEYIASNRARVAERVVHSNAVLESENVVASNHSDGSDLSLEAIDDTQLLELLSASGKPSVLAEVNGKTVVVHVQ